MVLRKFTLMHSFGLSLEAAIKLSSLSSPYCSFHMRIIPVSYTHLDVYKRQYLYYPICEVVDLLHCGRQKAVNTLRELQYAELIDIKKQGCGKPNCIYPKSYEAVSNADFKKSDFGTPKV